MIDFNSLCSANKYVEENLDKFFETYVQVNDVSDWTERDKEKFKIGLTEGILHGYYNALIKLKENNNG